MNKIEVSIIIPCHDEEGFISKCIDSIIKQDYPKENLEIFVIDGMSKDKTREIVKSYEEKYPYIKLLDNPQVYAPFALNIGIKNAKGDFILRMDAHGFYSNNYISECVNYIKKYNADVVGGATKTIPFSDNIVSKAIVISLSHLFTTGGSAFRSGAQKPKWVDTVFGGCYRKEIFEKVGLYNEKLIRSQDMEFSLRIKKAGGKILLIPEIVAYYYPKSNLNDFFRHNFIDGVWAIYPLRFSKTIFRPRHYIPLIFVSSVLLSGLLGILFPFFRIVFLSILALYFLVSFYFSFEISQKEKNPAFLFLMPVVFIVRHFGYGFGSLWGVMTIFRIKK